MNYDPQSFLAELTDLLEEERGSLSPETSLFDIESWDSVNVVSFMTYVDRKFHLVLSPQALSECQTVGDLMALVENRLQQAA
jgi:acyl carrier protein